MPAATYMNPGTVLVVDGIVAGTVSHLVLKLERSGMTVSGGTVTVAEAPMPRWVRPPDALAAAKRAALGPRRARWA